MISSSKTQKCACILSYTSKYISSSSLSFVRFNSTSSTSKWSRFVPTSGVYPKGFKLSAIHCGIKKKKDLQDLVLIHLEKPCNAAGVFTTIQFPAAPVIIDKQILSSENSKINSVIINSGCANAITGDQGLKNAQEIIDTVDSTFKNPTGSTLIMSTGVIGQQLPMDKVLNGVSTLKSKLDSLPYDSNNPELIHDQWYSAAKGIMTTDTFPKFVSKEFTIGSQTYRIAGLAKGAGMIAPNMATLLGFFLTDAPISKSALQKALIYAIDRSFNNISVDNDMSTNDTIVALSNGIASENSPLITEDSPEYSQLQDLITTTAQDLAKLLVRDGEGATKFVTVTVKNAPSFSSGKAIAKSIAQSYLVKTALFGKDANWGRIMAAVGYTKFDSNENIKLDISKVNLSFIPSDGSLELKLLVKGQPEKVDEERASEILEAEDLEVCVDIGLGDTTVQHWTCDLSHDYVTINGDYRS